MIDAPCVFCGKLVYASPKPETWGIEWDGKWVHYKCANDLFEAIKRIQNASDAELEDAIEQTDKLSEAQEALEMSDELHT